jgi:excisionase family DNA binding protein
MIKSVNVSQGGTDRLTSQEQTSGLLLGTQEVSGMLGVARRTVCLWAKLGELPAFKMGRHWRFRLSVIHSWLNQKESQSQSD